MSSTSSTRDPQPRRGHRHVLGDHELAADRAAFGRVGMRRQDRERPLVDPRQHIADAHAAARDADDLVEVVARLVDVEREPFDERVVLRPSSRAGSAIPDLPLGAGRRRRSLKRVAQQDRLVAVRPRRDHRDRRAGERLDPLEVRARIRAATRRSFARRRCFRSSPAASRRPARTRRRHRRPRAAARPACRAPCSDVQMRISRMPSSTSSLVMQRPSTPFNCSERVSAGMSSQPQRRGRPVTEPNSLPRFASVAPTSSVSSVGNGPVPTRVVYALTIPST